MSKRMMTLNLGSYFQDKVVKGRGLAGGAVLYVLLCNLQQAAFSLSLFPYL